MRQIRKLLGLTRAQQWLLLRAGALVGAAVIGIRVLPFSCVASRFGAHARALSRRRFAEEQVAEAVAIAGRYVPGANCLSNALACRALLSREGYAGDLRIGIRKSDSGVQAHAWIECGGRILIGGGQSPSEFSPLPAMELSKFS